MISLLSTAEESIKAFLMDVTSALGFWGVFGIVAGVELLFILFFAIKSAFSYEARLRRSLDKLNSWLFSCRTINEGNIKRFNALVKTGPKRLVYYWQQFILYREGGPKEYLTEENLIKKPLQTSSWANNVKNLSILTYVWAAFSAVVGFAVQSSSSALTIPTIAFSLLFPAVVLLMGVVSILIIRSRRASNLDEIYHLHHLFVRFIQNACAELPPYIDFNLLFTPKEIEKGNANLREYYEQRARQAKKEFDEARANDVKYVEYDFKDVGVDGTLLLNRAMRESEKFINKKTKILSQIAQVETQKDTLRRNYENIQIDLQRKIQVSKENIKALIEKQAATTSRIEAQLLKQQQDKEIAKQADLQKDYDTEEAHYNSDRADLEKEVERLNAELATSMEEATAGMSSEYQSFFEKVMQNAYVFADKKVEGEKKSLAEDRDKCEDELVSVQTQVKHLLDENNVLRNKLASYDPKFKQKMKAKEGKYENGLFVNKDGAYHDENGFYHDTDGKVYNSLGEQVSYDETEEQTKAREEQEMKDNQVELFGSYVSPEGEEKVETSAEPETENQPFVTLPAKEERPVAVDITPVPEQVEENAVTEKNKEIPAEAQVESVDFNELFGSDNSQPEEPAVQQQEELAQTETDLPQSQEENMVDEVSEEKQNDNNSGIMDLFAPAEESAKETDDDTAKEPKTEPETPAKKRGRPRKVVQKEVPAQEKRGRGRPRKEETPAQPVAKKRGRPRKEEGADKTPATVKKANKTEKKGTSTKSETKPKARRKSVVKTAKKETDSPAKKRGRPRKTEVAPAKKRGRPRKTDNAQVNEVDSLARINQLIHEEEAKLKNIKSIISDQLDEAMEKASQSKIEQERAEILEQVEKLQVQALDAQHEGKVDVFASINTQIEALINRLAELNKR